MRGNARVSLLKELAALRDVQRAAAEQDVARAAARVREAEVEKAREMECLHDEAAAWRHAFSSQRVDIAMMSAWSGAIRRREGQLLAADGALRHEEQAHGTGVKALHMAIANHDNATTAWRKARRAHRQKQEEVAAGNLSDRQTWRTIAR